MRKEKSLSNLRRSVSVCWIHCVLNTQFVNADIALPECNGYYLKTLNNDEDNVPKQNLH